MESGPIHQSFVTHGGYRYAVAPLLMAAACAAGYLAQPGNQQPNGGTWLGLTLGTIAAAMILILMGYGIRRRTFRAREQPSALPVQSSKTAYLWQAKARHWFG